MLVPATSTSQHTKKGDTKSLKKERRQEKHLRGDVLCLCVSMTFIGFGLFFSTKCYQNKQIVEHTRTHDHKFLLLQEYIRKIHFI